jgi:site-specific DNA-cytosine methylase
MSKCFLEFCSGGGGLSLGLIKAGLKPLLLNDNNKLCCQTLKLNHPNVQIVNTDMNDLVDEKSERDILTQFICNENDESNIDLICFYIQILFLSKIYQEIYVVH